MTADDLSLSDHLSYVPQVTGTLPARDSFDTVLACGMGGSGLPIRVASALRTRAPFVLHDSFDLPARLPSNPLCVAVSYSGNTEETVRFARAAIEAALPLVVITTGGELASLAQERDVPHVLFEHEPRPARDILVPMLVALLSVTHEDDVLASVREVQPVMTHDALTEGERIGNALAGTIPIVYAAHKNAALAYIWKIMFNETAKMPAFASAIPEALHNELQGFDSMDDDETTKRLSAILVRSETGADPVVQRFDVFKDVLSEHGVSVEELALEGLNRPARFIYGWLVARAATRTIADRKGVDPSETPLIDTFKERLV